MLDLLKFLFKKKRLNEIIINNKFRLFLLLFFVNILIIFLSRVVFIELEDLGLINKINNEKKISHTGFKLLFFTGFLIPIIEEIINRLWLKFNQYYLPISTSLFVFLFSFVFIFDNDINSLFLMPLDVLMSFFISLLVFIIIKKIVFKNINKIIFIYNKYILELVFLSSLIFSFLHLSMYNFATTNSVYFIPVFLLPYFVAGVLLSYIRLKMGLVSVLIFHILHNSLFISLKIFLVK